MLAPGLQAKVAQFLSCFFVTSWPESRTIHTAQIQHLSKSGKMAMALSGLGPPPAGAELIPGDLAAGKKSGYLFQLQGTPRGYSITAAPESKGGTGRRSFFSDQSMIVRENWGPEPATVASKEVGT
ncbi:MAG: hypothetical protein FJW38_11505 [Acidobacteria bacterium]|nr:hypothetical protein [Acidobacteriota bacterium]